jgi:hypothetical protein
MLYAAADPKSFSRNVAAAIAMAKTIKRIPIIEGEKRYFMNFIITFC